MRAGWPAWGGGTSWAAALEQARGRGKSGPQGRVGGRGEREREAGLGCFGLRIGFGFLVFYF